jgi:hypothetical protein
MIEVDLAAAATLIFGAQVPAFKEGTTTATAWGIMLFMMVLAVTCAFCYSFIITGMQARLMGYWDII